MNDSEREKLEDQASAWQSVCEALDEASPGWWQAEGTGEECAVAAIKRLATQPQTPQGAVTNWGDCTGMQFGSDCIINGREVKAGTVVRVYVPDTMDFACVAAPETPEGQKP